MNIIFPLTFFGILSVCWSAAPPVKVCKNVQAKADLDLKRFFSGKWYVSNAGDASHPCQENKNEVKEDGTITHVVLDYDKSRIPAMTHLDCKTNMKDVKDNKASFSCKLRESPETWELTNIGTVIETDYDNFAIYDVCSKLDETVLGDYVLVMLRNKDAEPNDPKIAEKLKSLGIDLDSLQSRKKRANCAYNSDL